MDLCYWINISLTDRSKPIVVLILFLFCFCFLFFFFLIYIYIYIFYGSWLSACTELMTHVLNGPIPPYLLTEHLAHSLDKPGSSSRPNWTSSTIPRSMDNVLGESACWALIGIWCKFRESHISHKQWVLFGLEYSS